MSQVMEFKILDVSLSYGVVPCGSDIHWSDAIRGREQKRLGVRCHLGTIPFQDIDNRAYQRNPSIFTVLGVVEPDMTVYQVQVFPAQIKDFTPPCACGQGQ